MGRATQGVRVMNCNNDDRVSAVALVVESAAGADVAEEADEVASEAAEKAAPKKAAPKRAARKRPDTDGKPE
jgi:hypothetical protein